MVLWLQRITLEVPVSQSMFLMSASSLPINDNGTSKKQSKSHQWPKALSKSLQVANGFREVHGLPRQIILSAVDFRSGNNCQKARSSGSKKKCAPLCNAALGCNPREPNMMERTTTNTTGWIFRILPHKTNTIQ